MDNKEIRCNISQLEIRESDNEVSTLVGYAAVFNSESQDLGGFIETIKPGAFSRSIQNPTKDIKALYNHDSASVLGRVKNGSLSLQEDEIGLRVTIRPPKTQFGRDILESVRSGYLDNMSFGFSVKEDSWEMRDGMHFRTLEDVELFEVSVVATPAYMDTSVAARNLEKVKESESTPVVEDATSEVVEAEAEAEVVEPIAAEADVEAETKDEAPVIDVEGLMTLGKLQKTIDDLKKDL